MAPKALTNPTIIVRDWSGAEPVVSWNGAKLAPDVHYFATVDSAKKELWLTLHFAVTQGELQAR